jgi:ubiquinone/menaquinone biosynthesis C-methylase UbiE
MKKTMFSRSNKICPVERAGSLDNRIRKWIQDPRKILGPYIEKGMTVLDIGCGPGYFSLDIAKMVGKSGRVIASDLQEGMLQKLNEKIIGTELEERITLHKSEKNKIGVAENFDFILAFYMLHEVPNAEDFFKEIKALLKPNGKILIVEPPLHVSKAAFENSLTKARIVGLRAVERPKIFLSKAAILINGSQPNQPDREKLC